MKQVGKAITATMLVAIFGMQSGVAQAQCSPTNPDCLRPQSSTGGGGGGTSVQVDVGDAAQAIGSIFKKKKKKKKTSVDQQVVADTTPVEQAAPQVVQTTSVPVIQVVPKPVRKTNTVARPKPQPVIRKSATRKIAAPVAVAVSAAKPLLEQEVAAELSVPEPVSLPVPEPVPAAEIVQTEAQATKAATITPVEEVPKPDNSLYWIIAGAAAALAAAGTAAKFWLTPKIALDCNIADGTSLMISNPSLTKPEVSFDVVIPGFSVAAPSNLSIVA